WPFIELRYSNFQYTPGLLQTTMDVLRVLFILLPMLALVGALRIKRWSLYLLLPFPLIAWTFGAGAVPFLSLGFPSVMSRAIAVAVVNLAFLFACAWLLWGKSSSSTSSPQGDH